jgi:predicted GH43/DUF377 family glycosyl hydrolase
MTVQVFRHTDQTLTPDTDRVVARLFMPSADVAHGHHALDLATRVMALPESEVLRLVGEVLGQFTRYHGNLRATLFEHAYPLIPRDAVLSEARQIILGAAFTAEYSLEGAALCNPSVVPHPDQSGLQPGELRVAVSLRAIGEGHFSALEFCSAVIGDTWRFVPRVDPPELGRVSSSSLPRRLFSALAREDDEADELTAAVLNLVPDHVSTSHVESVLDKLPPDLLLHPSAHSRAEVLRRAARSGYYVSFDPSTPLDRRVIMPAVDEESHGVEDARFTLFRDDEGSVQYRATYTAYDGHRIRVRMLSSADLASFQSLPLSGPGAHNKGMALFPRKIGGRFAALSRHDGARNGVSFSDDGLIWDEPTVIEEPGDATWTIRQLGNAGAPLETDDGWLVLTHGVGLMRVYSLGALLLDRDDPTRVLARLEEPWLTEHPDHGGYVPNVVFSCGGIIHNGRLFVPFGVGDKQLSVASLDVDELIGAMRREG